MGGGSLSSDQTHLEGILEDEFSSSDYSSHPSELDFENPTSPSSRPNNEDNGSHGDRSSRKHGDVPPEEAIKKASEMGGGSGSVSSDQSHLEGILEDGSSSSDHSSHPSELDFKNLTSPSSRPNNSNNNDDGGDGDRSSRKHGNVPPQEAAPSSSKLMSEEEISERRRRLTYLDILKSYEEPTRWAAPVLLEETKNYIRSYKPGMWIEKGVGGIPLSSYDVPSTTTLLLVGPRGSGKSSLVNRISRVFEDGGFILPEDGLFPPERAQVSHNLSTTEGTCFLQEYMIPRRDSVSFCMYDSRSLSDTASENYKLLRRWMTQGVRHGEMVLRDSDSSLAKKNIKAMARNASFCPSEKRTINFVIFVVNGLSVLKSIDSQDTHYNDAIVETFNYPFMSFKDNKPVVVVTHGDVLSFDERAQVRMHLGELLGIPPTKQIFDIPDTKNVEAELAIVDMLCYSLEHADRNIPFKKNYQLEVQWMLQKMMSCFEMPQLFNMPQRAVSQVQKMCCLEGPWYFETWLLMLEVYLIFICIIIFLLRLV